MRGWGHGGIVRSALGIDVDLLVCDAKELLHELLREALLLGQVVEVLLVMGDQLTDDGVYFGADFHLNIFFEKKKNFDTTKKDVHKV